MTVSEWNVKGHIMANSCNEKHVNNDKSCTWSLEFEVSKVPQGQHRTREQALDIAQHIDQLSS